MSSTPEKKSTTELDSLTNEPSAPTVFELASSIQLSLQELLNNTDKEDVQFEKSINSIYERLKNLED